MRMQGDGQCQPQMMTPSPDNTGWGMDNYDNPSMCGIDGTLSLSLPSHSPR